MEIYSNKEVRMSIDAKPEEFDAVSSRFYDNRRPKQAYDNVDRPMHYDGTVECIDYIRDRLGHEGFIAYCWGSVIKYQHRWKEKGGVESLRKARWFLDRLIKEETNVE
jgi:hypothetical protein